MDKCKYQQKEILKFAFSLILASLSVNLMFVVDRVVLGLYSLTAVNAVSLGGNFVATVSFLITSVAQIASVFTGQYNGLGEYKKTARAPWQMLYLGLASFLFFIPMGLWCEHFHIFPSYCEMDGLVYTRILLMFIGFHVMSVAVASFFIGRAQSYVVICIFLLGNIINALLDVVFVLGVPGIISPMGAKGAAIATVIVEFLFLVAFGVVFLKKENRKNFCTDDFSFHPRLFLKCIRVGLPVSLGKFTSLLGWYVIMYCFVHTSPDLATIETFVMTLWMAFIFFADGAGRAITSLAANFIGQQNLPGIVRLLKLFLRYNGVVCAMYAIPLILYPNMMISFFSHANGDISHLIPDIKFVLISSWLILFTDGIFYLFSGVLTAGGDTKFPTIVEVSTLWLMVVIPTGIMYLSGSLLSIRPVYTLIPLTGIINIGLVYLRYRKLKWYKQLVGSQN